MNLLHGVLRCSAPTPFVIVSA